jgi:hypothetical protein
MGYHHPQESPITTSKALQDAVVSHDFDVILVCADAHVRGSGERRFLCGAVRHKNPRAIDMKPDGHAISSDDQI